MSNDDFLTRLRADWHGNSVDLQRMRRRNERRDRFAAVYRRLSLIGLVGLAALCAWFSWRAVTSRDPLEIVASAALLITVPLVLLEYVESRRERRINYDGTPRGVLLVARQQLLSSRRLLRGCRWSAAILGAAALAAVLLAWSGKAQASVALPIAAVWGLTAALVLAWQAWRAGRIAREKELCERLLDELDAPDV